MRERRKVLSGFVLTPRLLGLGQALLQIASRLTRLVALLSSADFCSLPFLKTGNLPFSRSAGALPALDSSPVSMKGAIMAQDQNELGYGVRLVNPEAFIRVVIKHFFS